MLTLALWLAVVALWLSWPLWVPAAMVAEAMVRIDGWRKGR